MSELKPMNVYRYHDGAISPNPWKVVIFFYELNLPFKMLVLNRDDPDIRDKEPLVGITPNGRMPAFEDPNTGVKLWESGAIIEYLLDVYDKDHRLSYTSFPQNGQGPYYGQRGTFLYLHEEQLPSAQERYAKEIRRILGVIDKHLVRTGREWLVGDKMCFADLMFVPWNNIMSTYHMGKAFNDEWQQSFPKCYDWHQRLLAVESVKQAQKFVDHEATVTPIYAVDVLE